MNFIYTQWSQVRDNAHQYKCTEVATNNPSGMIFHDVPEYTLCFHNFTKSQTCPEKNEIALHQYNSYIRSSDFQVKKKNKTYVEVVHWVQLLMVMERSSILEFLEPCLLPALTALNNWDNQNCHTKFSKHLGVGGVNVTLSLGRCCVIFSTTELLISQSTPEDNRCQSCS